MTPDVLHTVSATASWDITYFAGLVMTGILFGCTICSFSCMPIVCTLVVGTRRGFKSGFVSAMTFAAGRTAGYTIAGMLCGLTGIAAERLFETKHLVIAAGILFLLTGISLVFFPGKPKCKDSSCASGCTFSGNRDMETKNPGLRLSSLGLITGIMPCAPYATVMAAAAASGSMLTGGLSAFCFGLGTCVSPLLLMGGGAGWFSKKIIEKTPDIDGVIRKIAGSIILIMGIRFILG